MATDSHGSLPRRPKGLRMRFHIGYFVLAAAIFIIEVLIALFLNDRLIRPYGGDFLVVILLYAIVRAFTNLSVIKSALLVLFFAYLIETAQYFDAVLLLGLEGNRVARTVIGQSFEWLDLVAYTLGIATVVVIERWRRVWP